MPTSKCSIFKTKIAFVLANANNANRASILTPTMHSFMVKRDVQSYAISKRWKVLLEPWKKSSLVHLLHEHLAQNIARLFVFNGLLWNKLQQWKEIARNRVICNGDIPAQILHVLSDYLRILSE